MGQDDKMNEFMMMDAWMKGRLDGRVERRDG